MNNAFITKTRFTLIRIGKVAPFIVCFVVFVSYVEDMYSLHLNKYIEFYDGIYLQKPISWFVAKYFKFDIMTLFVLTTLSFATETCRWNKLSCLYLAINLAEKSYFDFEIEPTYIYIICLANIIVAGYLTYKGLIIISRKHERHYH